MHTPRPTGLVQAGTVLSISPNMTASAKDQGHGGSAKVGNTTVHPSTTFWYYFWYGAAALYAYIVFSFASWAVIALVFLPVALWHGLPFYLHARIYPYRNGIVEKYIRTVSDGTNTTIHCHLAPPALIHTHTLSAYSFLHHQGPGKITLLVAERSGQHSYPGLRLRSG